jgi:4-diphosphocytidyl-2C-methyl-D-erythritol kinase
MLKAELEENVTFLKQQNEFLQELISTIKEEKESYKLQVEKLQDALIATRSPEAYRDIRADRVETTTPDLKEVEKRKQRADLERQYVNSIEEPTFRTAEEMDDLVSELIFKKSADEIMTGKSIHGNSES